MQLNSEKNQGFILDTLVWLPRNIEVKEYFHNYLKRLKKNHIKINNGNYVAK